MLCLLLLFLGECVPANSQYQSFRKVGILWLQQEHRSGRFLLNDQVHIWFTTLSITSWSCVYMLVGDHRWFTGQNSLLSGFCHDALLRLAALCSRYCRGEWSYSWRLVRRFGSSPSRTSRETPKQETPMTSRSSSAASCSLQIHSKIRPSRRSTSSWIHPLKSSDFSSCLYTAQKYLWNMSV